jgi:asparagine synthase (glutamine-hydrolysing)
MDEFVADFPRILDAMDQPSVDGINTWFASKAAAERGYKVALSGAGGDELFCGYRSFRDVPRLAALGRWAARVPLLGRVLDPIAASYSRFSQSPKWAAAPTLARSLESAYFLSRGIFLPSDLPKLIGERDARVGLEALGFPLPTASRIEATTSVAAVAAMESTLYLRNQLLRDADWASMAHSLELRTPLVDAALSAAVAPFTRYWTGGEGKRSLAHAASRPLPQVVMQRQKTGFGIPLASWLDAALPPRKQLEAEWGSQAIGAHWSRRLALSLVRAF